MIRVAAMVAILGWPGPFGRWLGVDKVKHFLVSAMVQSTVYSGVRAVGASHQSSQIAGGAAVVGFGLAKEVVDRRARRPFSVEDLVWDAAGGVAAAALLNGTR